MPLMARTRCTQAKRGMTRQGRFIPYWNRSKTGEIQVEPQINYEKEGPGDYYQRPRKTGRECIIDPYLYPVQGNATLMVSLVAPILANSTFCGIGGVDLRIEFLQQLADDVDVCDRRGCLYLVSHSGTLAAATGQPNLVGRPVHQALPSREGILQLVGSGQEDVIATRNELWAITPIQIGQSATPLVGPAGGSAARDHGAG